MWDSAKTIPRGKYVALYSYITKLKSQINNLLPQKKSKRKSIVNPKLEEDRK